jgi:hypothetical protein
LYGPLTPNPKPAAARFDSHQRPFGSHRPICRCSASPLASRSSAWGEASRRFPAHQTTPTVEVVKNGLTMLPHSTAARATNEARTRRSYRTRQEANRVTTAARANNKARARRSLRADDSQSRYDSSAQTTKLAREEACGQTAATRVTTAARANNKARARRSRRNIHMLVALHSTAARATNEASLVVCEVRCFGRR